MLKNRVFYILLLTMAAMLYIFTNTYYTLTILGLCVAAPVISLILMLFSRHSLSIDLTVPATAEKKNAVITYTFENSGRMPAARVTFRIQLENQMTGALKERKVNVTVGSREKVEAQLSLQNSKVGTVLIRTGKVRVYDAFGLFAFRKADLHEQLVVIYPDMHDIAVYMEKPVETTVDGSRYSPDRPGQDVSEIFALREYAAGDEIRKIHWKLSGKLDRTMVRDFSLPLNYSVFLLLELTLGSEDLVDAEVETYLSLSRALLENGINHNIGWYDAGTDLFNVKELDNFEDLEMASAQVLSSYASQKAGNSLDFYMESGYRNQSNILIYVVIDPPLDKVAELEVSQRMQTIMVYEDEAAAEAAQQMIEVMAVSVKEVSEGMPEIIV